MNYFIYQNDQERGPYTRVELIKSVNGCYIQPFTMAREEHSDQWMEVSAIISQTPEQPDQASTQTWGNLLFGTRPEQQPSTQPSTQHSPSKEIKIKPFEAPYIVGIHYVVAGICFFGSFISLLVLGGNSSERETALNSLVIFLSSGIALIVAGYIIGCLAECAFRLRNIEFNTAKAAEKN
jgi:hypothetical protein